MSILMKVISGGQIGVDRAALTAARECGIPTGGWIPKGFRTLGGSNPALASFGLIETPETDYRTRTWLNVRDADFTLRCALDFSSPGERCTLQAINYFRKPSLDIDLLNPTSVDFVAAKLANVKVLNVAGNADLRAGTLALGFLVRLFTTLNPHGVLSQITT